MPPDLLLSILPSPSASSPSEYPISPADSQILPSTLTHEFRCSLQRHPMFCDLMQSPSFFHDLIHLVSCRSVNVGDTLIKAGEPGKAMFFVVKGQVAVTTKDGETVLAVLGPGQFFGEMALMLNSPRVATVTCIEKAILLVLQQSNLSNLFERYPNLKVQFGTITLSRLKTLKKHHLSIEELVKGISGFNIGIEKSQESLDEGKQNDGKNFAHVEEGGESIDESKCWSEESHSMTSGDFNTLNIAPNSRTSSPKMDSVVNPSVLQVMMKDPSKRRASVAVWSDPKLMNKLKENKPIRVFSILSGTKLKKEQVESAFLKLFLDDNEDNEQIPERICNWCTIQACIMLSSTTIHLNAWLKQHPNWATIMDLSSCKTVDDDVLKLLTRDWAQHIEVINFQNSFAITDAGLIPLLGNCTKLRILNLKNCWNVLLANVPDSISIPTLISLNLDNVRKLTNKSLQYCFQSFPSLMKLSLSYCKLIDDIQGPCWPRLQSLNLHRCTNITQEAFTKCLSQGPDEWQLRNFNLADHHGLLDATLQLFASKTPWLTSLNLSFCSSITPACISSLRKWDLIVLDVSYCLLLVNDEVLEHFSAFPSLKGLGLRGCSSITDNGLSHLFKLETLKTINISQCPKLSPTIHEKAKMSWKCLTTQSIFEIDYSTA